MSDLDHQPPDSWIASLQSMQPASLSLNERELFYRAGFQAAQRRHKEQRAKQVESHRTLSLSWRWGAVASLLVAVASMTGFMAGRFTASDPSATYIATAPGIVETETPVVSDQPDSQPLDNVPAVAVAVTRPVPDQDDIRINWLTRWMPGPFEIMNERGASQDFIAFPSKLDADDWLTKNEGHVFFKETLLPRSSGDREVTELVSTGIRSKTLTPADVRELTEDWENMK